MKVLLIGAGEIAREYIVALLKFGYIKIDVLSKSNVSAEKLVTEFSLGQSFGGGESSLKRIIDDYDRFIIATPIETLLPYLYLLTGAKKNNILVEKPVSLKSNDLKKFINEVPDCSAAVALNRLYFPSILKMKDILESQELTSVEFSFTEWVHRIDQNKFSINELNLWGVSNCIHVIATVFNIIGAPQKLNSYVTGKDGIEWHPSGSVFVGSGITEKGVSFSYSSDWLSAGRWSITFRTKDGSYQLSPMEALTFCPKGTIQEIEIIENWSGNIKCGFEKMLESWINEEKDALISISDLKDYVEIIENIFKYEK